MQKEINWSSYAGLFETEWAVAVFLEQRKDSLDDWEFILRNFVYKKKDNRKDLADNVFSVYIRLKNADKNGRCKCITCGKVLHWREIQNWHYRSRLCNKYRFDERNCHPQCKHCNVMLNGNYRNYHIYMVDTYGEEVESMLRNDKESIKYKQKWYEDSIMEWWKFIKWVLYWDKIKIRDE